MTHLQIILKKMCEVVNVDYYKVDFTTKNWYLQQAWTVDQEKKFKKWAEDYIKKNRDARMELMGMPRAKIIDIKKYVSSFVLSYGWRYSD